MIWLEFDLNGHTAEPAEASAGWAGWACCASDRVAAYYDQFTHNSIWNKQWAYILQPCVVL